MSFLVDGYDFERKILYPGRIVAEARSKVQRIAIADIRRFQGRSLWIKASLDKGRGKFVIQFHEHDEHQYHHMLVFPGLATVSDPREGLVLGGGDYPAAARIAMCKGVKHVLVADWDRKVGELVLKHISRIRAFGVHLDQRFDFSREIDVAKLLPSAPSESRHWIIGDLVDVRDLKKIHPQFLEHCYRILRPGGFVTFQAGSYSRTADRIRAIRCGIRDLLRAGFSAVWLWHEFIDSFGGQWLFMAGWKAVVPSREPVSREKFGAMFDLSRDRQHYSPEIHRRAFTLDPWVKELVTAAKC